MRSQENDIVSTTKAIIETYFAMRHYHHYSERIIQNTTIKVHFTTETMPKVPVTLMNF